MIGWWLLAIVGAAAIVIVPLLVWRSIQAGQWSPTGAEAAIKACWGCYWSSEPGPFTLPPWPRAFFIKPDGTAGKYGWTDVWGRKVAGHCIFGANAINVGFPRDGTGVLADSALPYEVARYYVYRRGLRQYDEPGGVDRAWFDALAEKGSAAVRDYFRNLERTEAKTPEVA